MKTKMDSQTLLILLKNRENRGYSILYDQYSKVLFNIIGKIVEEEEEVENLLQDTFVKIWKRIDHYDDSKGTLFTWMLNIARNTAIDFVRSKFYTQQAKKQTLEEYIDNEISEENTTTIDHLGLRELVERLDPACRDVIDLTYFIGFTQKEAAQKLKIPIGTLKTRNHIAIRELRKWI